MAQVPQSLLNIGSVEKAMIDTKAFRAKASELSNQRHEIEGAIEKYRKLLSDLETITLGGKSFGTPTELSEIVSYTHFAVLNALLPSLNVVDEGVRRAFFRIQAIEEAKKE